MIRPLSRNVFLRFKRSSSAFSHDFFTSKPVRTKVGKTFQIFDSYPSRPNNPDKPNLLDREGHKPASSIPETIVHSLHRKDRRDDPDTQVSMPKLMSPAKEALIIRCTEIDDQGSIRLLKSEIRKTELCTKHGLLPRDLRKIDLPGNAIFPSILVRENSILINLLHIRALIKSDMVILFDSTGGMVDSHTQSLFLYDLESKLRQSSVSLSENLPYEFRAIEAILISVVSVLNTELHVIQDIIDSLLRELELCVNSALLRRLLIVDKRISAFKKKSSLIRDSLEEILEQDDDLAAMYLTEKKMGKERSEDSHEEIELLFEAYLKQSDELVQTADDLINNIDSTRETINITLDAQRNSLLFFSIKISVLTLGISAGAFIGSLFGMNLKNYFEDSAHGFATASFVAGGIIFLIAYNGFRLVKKKQVIGLLKGLESGFGRVPGSNTGMKR